MKALIGLSALLLILIQAAAPSLAGEAGPAANLSTLIKTALINNPELKASQSRWQMFANRVTQASALEDPMLMVKIQNGVVSDPLNFRKEVMTSKVLGISQQVPFWGKRALKEEIAAKDAESYRWQLEERKLELARMIKETWYRLYFTDRSEEIIAKNIRILDDFITLAETKYSVGQGAQQDLFRAQLERSKMLDMQITLQQQRKSLAATLNTLVSRPPETPLDSIADFDIVPLQRPLNELRETARQNRPMLKSLQALIDKGEAGLQLSRKEFYPDFNVSLEYMQREPTMGEEGLDMYSLGVTFNLPLQQERRHAMVAEANAETGMAAAELHSLTNSIAGRIADLLARLERQAQLASLYKTGIIPQAEQSLESATIGYQVNKVDFLALLDSRMTLFNYERNYYESLADYQMSLAELEAVVGAELQ